VRGFVGFLVDSVPSKAELMGPVSFPTKGVMTVSGKLVYESGAGTWHFAKSHRSTDSWLIWRGIITLHPHPTSLYGLAAIIAGNDSEGLELAARLFPLRTGVPVSSRRRGTTSDTRGRSVLM
jgi:hypothetical protein